MLEFSFLIEGKKDMDKALSTLQNGEQFTKSHLFELMPNIRLVQIYQNSMADIRVRETVFRNPNATTYLFCGYLHDKCEQSVLFRSLMLPCGAFDLHIERVEKKRESITFHVEGSDKQIKKLTEELESYKNEFLFLKANIENNILKKSSNMFAFSFTVSEKYLGKCLLFLSNGEYLGETENNLIQYTGMDFDIRVSETYLRNPFNKQYHVCGYVSLKYEKNILYDVLLKDCFAKELCLREVSFPFSDFIFQAGSVDAKVSKKMHFIQLAK